MKNYLAAAILVLSTNFASAGSTMEGYGSVPPLRGHMDWCLRHNSECDVDVKEPRLIEFNSKVLRDLMFADAAVNAVVDYKTDREVYDQGDYWDYPKPTTRGRFVGDCEDYAIMKRRRLVEMGYPHRAMRLAYVIAPNGEDHAVLVVRTTNGDYVLDMYEKRNVAMLWNRKRRFVWISMESQEPNTRTWVGLGAKTVR